MGQPLENAQRTAIVTVALGRAAEVAARDLKDAYVLAFLRYVGCTADAPIAAAFRGRRDRGAWLVALVELGPTTTCCRADAQPGAGKSALKRARLIANLFMKIRG